MGGMHVIETRDYKWDRGRASRPVRCSARGLRVACAGTGERRPDYFPCTQPRENR
ncbi:hypothetical protein BURMUCGD2M_2968 [Burkholderia multivorans CGD2M]|uniref:Uncharacterized protein n=1 Tax=Burkholderia multivorans CGD2 TaxID=513052 RepID=B9BSW0_9BURK|nr:hypothetical protein BURMUCGD2_2883 [Burkholderia multivorans CGD2]EEE11368.1 hypothetical protein BURMUCGD2M_2968 [Burkholderia multivorans CGD2M]